MIKFLICLSIVIVLFIFILADSKTWETQQVTEEKHGVEYVVLKHSIRWDRFFDYIEALPHKIQRIIFRK